MKPQQNVSSTTARVSQDVGRVERGDQAREYKMIEKARLADGALRTCFPTIHSFMFILAPSDKSFSLIEALGELLWTEHLASRYCPELVAQRDIGR